MNARATPVLDPRSPFARWHAHFHHRRSRPLPAVHPPALPTAVHAAVLRSLTIFQLGESGEGRIAHQVDRTALPPIDADYRAALKLFVAEEGRHARILGRMVRAMGGRTLQATWTEGLFRHGRRLMGIRLKLLVLLAAEVVAVVFYGALADHLPASGLTAALREIIADEDHHLAFHVDFFRRAAPTRAHRLVFHATWWAVALAACAVVAADHRATLGALGVSATDLARTCLTQVARVSRLVAQPPRARRQGRGTSAGTASMWAA